uniref:hypothetical protein n=1 Tax=Campylaephora boydenii TaxID=202204 RepID=UPI002551E492|nr:hypothetical protein QQR83_pgp081 [Campylaephora boydenii]WGT74040.1 hypothetical protein [Campylaephora boydenii]
MCIQSLFISFYYYACYFYIVFMFIIYILCILKLSFNKKYLLFSQYLAFNINIMYQMDNRGIFSQIKKIYFTKSNAGLIRKKSYKLLNRLVHPFNIYDNTFLQLYLNSLKLSGYVHSINYMKIIINNKKYFQLCIKVNPIIKNITIYNHENLIISSNQLKNLLTNHLGLPMNYKIVKKSIEKIFLWYKLQGFEWIQIEFSQNENLNNIQIVIIEKKLLSSRIICMNRNKVKNYEFINNAITLDIQLLNGSVLNRKTLDSTIQIIKNKYLLEDISYKVMLNDKDLDIVIKYSLKTDKSIKVYYFPYLFNNINQLFDHYCNKFIISLYKIRNIFIHTYNLKYLVDLIININKYCLINVNISFINSYIYKFIKSFNIVFYYFNYLRYSLNLFLIQQMDSKIKQKLFFIYLINIEIKNECSMNQHLKFIQFIYYFKSRFYSYFINFNQREDNIYDLLKKYRKDTICQTSFYKVSILCDYSVLIFSLINNIVIKVNYYLFLYFHDQYNNSIKLYSQLFNLSIINQCILKYNTCSWHLKIKFNISKILVSKLKLLPILIINSSKYQLQNYNPLINLNINYTFSLNKYNTLYLFNNYSICNYTKLITFLGFGLQIHIPFKQITYIRLEYIINMKNQIYLFIDKFSV